MNAQREMAAMQHTNAGDFAKIIAALTLCAAKVDDDAPEHHKGIYISLFGYCVIFSSIRYGQTTEIEIVGDVYAPNERHFFLSYDDLEHLYIILAHDANAPVLFTASRQPQTHGECVRITVDDWYDGYMGSLRAKKTPYRSKRTRTRSASASDLASVYGALSNVAEQTRYKVDQNNPEKETVVSVVHPLPGLYSAKSYLY